MNTPAQTIRAFWDAIQARDWDSVYALLHEDFHAEFPQSGERFDRRQFLAVNRFYPGDWTIRVRELFECDRCVITEVEVEIDDRTDGAISFFFLRDGRVSALREFWPEPFPVPEWRVALLSTGGSLYESK